MSATIEVDEADVLRAAAGIKNLLDDGRLHPWGDCIELARDFTEGRMRAASDLAWKALTEYVNLPVVWTGTKGSKLIAFVEPETAINSVDCPKCGAVIGQPCINLGNKSKPKSYPHGDRLESTALQTI